MRGAGGDIKYTYRLIPAIATSLPAGAIQGLLNSLNVTSIEADIEVHAGEEVLPWGVDRIDAEAVHPVNNGNGVRVAVLDSGIDPDHPDLAPDESVNFANGRNPDDKCGHGTHVAGTVAALDNDSGVIGVAPGVTLIIVKVLGNNCSGSYSDVIAGLQWVVDNKIQVTNNGYGSSGDPGSLVKQAFDNSYAAGVLHIAAAGNASGGAVIYPAKWFTVVAVSATTDTDALASFSSVGAEVEIAGPGASILSTTIGGGTGTMSGTSMASPHVAGVAALVVAAGITDGNGLNGIADEIRARLNSTAEDIGLSTSRQDSGLVNAENAALGTNNGNNLGGGSGEPANNPPTVSITSPADSSTFDSGATILFEGTASDTEDGDLTASLVWTSDIDGQIGTGGSFSTALSDGNHTITASVTDSGGATGSDSNSITVGDPPADATSVSVSVVTYATGGGKNQDKHLLITVALVDDLGNVVSGASMSIDLFRDGSPSGSGTGATGTDGSVTFSLKNAKSGTYTTTVTDVTATGLSWDGITPPN